MGWSVPPKPNCRGCGKPKPKGRGRKYCDACTTYRPKRVAPPNHCNDCHERVPKGRQYCDECRDLRRWKTTRRTKLKRRKPCRRCGGQKGAGQRMICAKCVAKAKAMPLCNRCQKRPRRYRTARLCDVCVAQAKLDTRARKRRYNEAHRDQRRSGGHRDRLRDNESRRLTNRLRSERDGEPIAPLTREEYNARYGTGFGNAPRVPVNAELRRLVQREIAEHGMRDDDRRMREVARGDAIWISLVTADRLCTQLGVPLNLVYPELAA